MFTSKIISKSTSVIRSWSWLSIHTKGDPHFDKKIDELGKKNVVAILKGETGGPNPYPQEINIWAGETAYIVNENGKTVETVQ